MQYSIFRKKVTEHSEILKEYGVINEKNRSQRKKYLEIKNFVSMFSVLWLSKGAQKIWMLTFKGQEKSTIRLILKFLVLCDSQLLFEF